MGFCLSEGWGKIEQNKQGKQTCFVILWMLCGLVEETEKNYNIGTM